MASDDHHQDEAPERPVLPMLRSFGLPVSYESGVDDSAYALLHKGDFRIAERTILAQGPGIAAWHGAMSLLLDYLQGSHKFDGTEVVQKSKTLRMNMIIGALLTSKTALETCVSGRYVQAMMMCRFLIESWIRIAYLDINPHATKLWMGMPGIPGQHPKNESMLKALKKHPEHRASAAAALKLIGVTDQYAHPSKETYASLIRSSPEEGILGTDYVPQRAIDCINLATIICLMISREIPNLITVDDAFQDRHRQLNQLLEFWRESVSLPPANS